MKKSFVNRSLQIASVIAVYAAISIWSSTAHVHIINDAITSLNSLLVILAIALGFPYFCFNVLAKLYTPPKSRNLDETSKPSSTKVGQNDSEAIGQDLESMQYRGTRYNQENMPIANKNQKQPSEQPVIKYRGASITNDLEKSSQNSTESFASERESQKSAKPKERIKYRGSYVD
jgi:type III secretory pathway component EscV